MVFNTHEHTVLDFLGDDYHLQTEDSFSSPILTLPVKEGIAIKRD